MGNDDVKKEQAQASVDAQMASDPSMLRNILKKDNKPSSPIPTTVIEKEDGTLVNENGEKLVDLSKPDADYQVQAGGDTVFEDKGQRIVERMNDSKQKFDDTEFIQELHDNYFSAVQSKAERHHPTKKIITTWDETTSFFDFLEDTTPNIQKELDKIRMAKAAKAKKFKVFEDSALAEMKIDAGSAAVGREFDMEDYEATEEILRRSLELIERIRSGKTNIIFDTRSADIRLSNDAMQV